MRIFYQSFGVSRDTKDGAYGRLLRRVIDSAAAPGTQVDVEGLSPNRALADQYRYLEFLDTSEVLENGLRAEAEKYDAFAIGNIFEPGLHELRELLNIPVLGLREASVHVACLMGANFSLINVNPKFVHRIVEGIRLQGLDSRMVSIDRMTVARPGMFDLAYTDEAVRQEILDEFTRVARQSVSKGAEVIIPAGGSLTAILIDSGLHEVDGAPVLNGIVALLKVTEMAAQMRKLTGTFTSKQLVYAPPTGQLLKDARQAYGSHIYPGAE